MMTEAQMFELIVRVRKVTVMVRLIHSNRTDHIESELLAYLILVQ